MPPSCDTPHPPGRNRGADSSTVLPMTCALCLYILDGPRTPAVTVVEGYAVCHDHLPYVAQGTRWYRLLEAVRHRGYTDTSGEF